MAADIETFLCLFDEFEGVPSKKIGAFFDLAKNRVDETVWGDCTDEAIYYLTGHLISSTGGAGGSGGGVAGPITSESVGSVSRSYGQVNVNQGGNDELYATTRYGQMFLNLRRSCVVTALATCSSIPGATYGEF